MLIDTIVAADVQGKTKEELLQLFDTKQNWSKGIVKHAINTLVDKNKPPKPISLKVGDTCFHRGLKHPCLIIKVNKIDCIHLLLTSEVLTYGLLGKLNTRYTDWQELYVSSTIGYSDNIRLLSDYIISIDQKQLLSIKKLLKLKYKGLFR